MENQTDEEAAAAVRAGVRLIEHGTYLSDQSLALVKERATCFVPTIACSQDMIVRDSLRCVRLKLWSEERKQLVPLPKP